MTGMLKKDLYMTKSSQRIFLFSSLMYILMYMFIKEVAFEGLIKDTLFSRTALSCLPLIISLEFNSKCASLTYSTPGAEKFFNSMPVSKASIVCAKFLTAILTTTYGLFFAFAAFSIFSALDHISVKVSGVNVIVCFYLAILMILALQMPVLVCTGNQLLSLQIPFFIFTTIAVILLGVNRFDLARLATKSANFMNHHHIIFHYYVWLFFGAALLMLCFSVFLSVKLYQRREY